MALRDSVVRFASLPALLLSVAIYAPGGVAQEPDGAGIGARINLDTTAYDSDQVPYASGSEFRRAQLSYRHALGEDWQLRLSAEFAGQSPEMRDLHLRYTGWRGNRIAIGSMKHNANLDDAIGSDNITFTERALLNTFSAGRRLGVAWQRWNRWYTASLAVMGNNLQNTLRSQGSNGRLVLHTPVGSQGLLHLGVNSGLETPRDHTLRRSARPEVHQDPHRLVDTGVITDVNHASRAGIESALSWGRLSLQGEFTEQRVDRRQARDLRFRGYYTAMSLFLTGESRPYNTVEAAFDDVEPGGPGGAWEAALRYSSLDLDDQEIHGGVGDAVTLGLNYYPNLRLRLSADYVWAHARRGPVDDDPNALQLRLRYRF